MGTRKRRCLHLKGRHSGLAKRVVIEILRQAKGMALVSSGYGVHPSQLHKWKRQPVEGLPSVFSDDKQGIEAVKADYEVKMTELYAETGRLTTQIDWL